MVEMVALANATGLRIDVAGMHGPNAELEALSDIFRLRTDGGVLHREGVADFTVGKGVAPGVFCVVKAPMHGFQSVYQTCILARAPCIHFTARII